MASLCEISPALEPINLPTDLLRSRMEGDILINMISRDDFSTAEAVEKIVALTTAAADEAFSKKAEHDESYFDALELHASVVGSCIVLLAKHIPHGQQSKLIDFVLRLKQVTVPDPKHGGQLERDREVFWTNIPGMALNLSEYHGMIPPSGTQEENDRYFENCTAFVAQLSELGYGTYKESLAWNYFPLTAIFEESREITRKDIRLVCIWFIYAPKKVWWDSQLCRERKSGSIVFAFKSEFWPKWKQFLQDSQQMLSEEPPDKDTQELLRHALENANMTEAAERQ